MKICIIKYLTCQCHTQSKPFYLYEQVTARSVCQNFIRDLKTKKRPKKDNFFCLKKRPKKTFSSKKRPQNKKKDKKDLFSVKRKY